MWLLWKQSHVNATISSGDDVNAPRRKDRIPFAFEMIEIILLIYIIPKIISPLAKVQGRSSVRWVLLAFGVFLATEFLILGIYFFTFELLTVFFGWVQTPDKFWLTSSVYVLALVCGLVSVDLIRRYLCKQPLQPLPNGNEPPPPPDFLD